MKTLLYICVASTISVNAYAKMEDRPAQNPPPSNTNLELVNWIGYIDAEYGHDTRHTHNLEFTRKSDGESFDIKDSPDLEKVHCNSSKRILVKIEAVKTPRFMFWGNNLIVKSFEVLEEYENIPHKQYKPRYNDIR